MLLVGFSKDFGGRALGGLDGVGGIRDADGGICRGVGGFMLRCSSEGIQNGKMERKK